MPGLRPASLLPAAVAAVAIGLSATATAATAATPQTVTFGASLTRPPDAPFDCTAPPLADGTTGPLAGDNSSCTWSTPVNPTEPLEGLLTPAGDGTITAVRIRAGATTGPMAFVVLQAETNVLTQAVTCCQTVLVTQPIMPTANEINGFRTDLPVHTDAPSQQSSPGVQVSDMLALSILSDGVQIPLVDETAVGLPAGQLPSDEIANPAAVQGQTSLGRATGGYQLDLQADWVPGTPPPPVPRVRFASGRTMVRHGSVHVPLRCRRDVCRGAIAVESGPRSGRVVYARGSFRIGQNLYRSIAVPLTADGRVAARRDARLDVHVDLSYQTPGAIKRISRQLALRF
jgi:hypothetical protein